MKRPPALVALVALVAPVIVAVSSPLASATEEPRFTARSQEDRPSLGRDTPPGEASDPTDPASGDATAAQPSLAVIIEGLDGDQPAELAENVRALLGLQALVGQPPPSPTRLRFLFDAADGEIRRALEPFGYYQPTIDKQLVTGEEAIEARFAIDPGEPIPLAQVEVDIIGEGRDDPHYQDLLTDLPQVGDRLDHRRYEAIKGQLRDLAVERGYFDARLRQAQIRVDLTAYEAAIVIAYDTGPRYRFGEVIFDQDFLSADLLARFVPFEPGEPYLAEHLIEFQSDLINSEYFDQVSVDTDPSQAVASEGEGEGEGEGVVKHLPVNVLLEPNRRTRYTFGLGYGTDTGPSGSVEVRRPLLNSLGHHFRVQLLASLVRLGLAGEYIIPGPDPIQDQYLLRTSASREVTDDTDSLRGEIGVGLRRVGPRWNRSYTLGYAFESFAIGDQGRDFSALLIPSLEVIYTDATGNLNSREGFRVTTRLRGASEFLLSTASFLQTRVGIEGVKSFWPKGFWITRLDTGATLTNQFDDLPTSLRFFAGGDVSIRGYNLNSISPDNDDGDAIGGRYLLTGSVEYEHRILDNWGVAAFVDGGSAFSERFEPVLGAGLGVRYFSPVGPIRVDLAHGFDEEDGELITFSLSIGPRL